MSNSFGYSTLDRGRKSPVQEPTFLTLSRHIRGSRHKTYGGVTFPGRGPLHQTYRRCLRTDKKQARVLRTPPITLSFFEIAYGFFAFLLSYILYPLYFRSLSILFALNGSLFTDTLQPSQCNGLSPLLQISGPGFESRPRQSTCRSPARQHSFGMVDESWEGKLR